MLQISVTSLKVRVFPFSVLASLAQRAPYSVGEKDVTLMTSFSG